MEEYIENVYQLRVDVEEGADERRMVARPSGCVRCVGATRALAGAMPMGSELGTSRRRTAGRSRQIK